MPRDIELEPGDPPRGHGGDAGDCRRLDGYGLNLLRVG